LATLLVPGHTGASIAYAGEGVVFSGDVLFQGSVGRSDLAGGDHETLIASIAAMARWLAPDTVVLSGHGPPTTFELELATNPFLSGLRM
jgi:glyoxylase-like metal-dependent hydrolase (beta-lactamase superfamily II)